MTPRSRVMLADDHTMIAQALGGYLQQGGFELVGIAVDGADLIDLATRLRPEIVIADISMPAFNGLEAMRRLKETGLQSKFIFLTMHDDAALACEAIRSGANGYLLKHSAGEELVLAISEVLRGRSYLTPRIAKQVIALLSEPTADHSALPHLTHRQREVLALVAVGQTMKEVAAQLDLSPRTVETHKYEIMQILGVKTTAELIHYAISHHLVAC